MSLTPEQRKSRTIAVFDLVACGYDHAALRLFPFSADRLVARLKPRPGSKVLDVGTGTGVVAAALAPALLPGGRVQAIDLSQSMLDQAMANAARTGLSNIDFHLMDAERLDFKSRYFDHVVSSFVLFFCSDMVATLKGWRRVLKPGGTVMFTSFTADAFEPYTSQLRERLRGYGVEWPQGAFQTLAEPQACIDLLSAAGFDDIEVHSEALGYHLATTEDWWQVLWNSGFRALLEQLSAPQLDQLRRQHLDEIAGQCDAKGLWLNTGYLLSSARRPATDSA